jgi:NADP-dependent 3-hydroxy acid dehydrogenase YdfG
MAKAKRSVLITGCSDGGTGAALAEVFHNSGLRVYATARNVKKMERLASLGIETLELDVLSESSIERCVRGLDSLDILVNNAGAQYTMPVSDLSIPMAKDLFDINVWAHIQVTQAFLPLLMKSESGMIVNHTSSASVLHVPFQSV